MPRLSIFFLLLLVFLFLCSLHFLAFCTYLKLIIRPSSDLPGLQHNLPSHCNEHKNITVAMKGRPIPQYPHSCLAPSPHSNTTVLLVGVSGSVNGRLEINSIDLSDINIPLVNLTNINEQILYWRSQSPIFCHNYPDFKPKDKELNPVHIQQFDPNWTFDANVYPSGNIDLPSFFPGVALTSARNYIVVGHLGSASWSLAHTNTTNAVSGSSWTTFQLNPVDSFKVFSE